MKMTAGALSLNRDFSAKLRSWRESHGYEDAVPYRLWRTYNSKVVKFVAAFSIQLTLINSGAVQRCAGPFSTDARRGFSAVSLPV